MGNFFTDVIKKSPKLTSKKRVADMALLEPETRKRVRAIIADAKEHGLKLMVFETYRSGVRQTELFNQGATKLKKVGVHHYGLACDLVRDVNGEPSWKGDFDLLGRLAHHHGLIWGGDWETPMFTTALSILFTCNAAPSSVKQPYFEARSIPTPPTTPTPTGNRSSPRAAQSSGDLPSRRSCCVRRGAPPPRSVVPFDRLGRSPASERRDAVIACIAEMSALQRPGVPPH
jgi:D-alanyl-D-alanine carboxypeptidase